MSRSALACINCRDTKRKCNGKPPSFSMQEMQQLREKAQPIPSGTPCSYCSKVCESCLWLPRQRAGRPRCPRMRITSRQKSYEGNYSTRKDCERTHLINEEASTVIHAMDVVSSEQEEALPFGNTDQFSLDGFLYHFLDLDQSTDSDTRLQFQRREQSGRRDMSPIASETGGTVLSHNHQAIYDGYDPQCIRSTNSQSTSNNDFERICIPLSLEHVVESLPWMESALVMQATSSTHATNAMAYAILAYGSRATRDCTIADCYMDKARNLIDQNYLINHEFDTTVRAALLFAIYSFGKQYNDDCVWALRRACQACSTRGLTLQANTISEDDHLLIWDLWMCSAMTFFLSKGKIPFVFYEFYADPSFEDLSPPIKGQKSPALQVASVRARCAWVMTRTTIEECDNQDIGGSMHYESLDSILVNLLIEVRSILSSLTEETHSHGAHFCNGLPESMTIRRQKKKVRLAAIDAQMLLLQERIRLGILQCLKSDMKGLYCGTICQILSPFPFKPVRTITGTDGFADSKRTQALSVVNLRKVS